MEKHKVIIPREEASKQVDLFLDYYDIVPEEDATNTMHRESLKSSVNRLIKHVSKGRLEITEEDDDLKVRQVLKYPINDVNELNYKVLGGVAKTQMKNAEDNDQNGKIYALVGSLTNWTGNSIAKLKGVDLSVAECLGILFLVV